MQIETQQLKNILTELWFVVFSSLHFCLFKAKKRNLPVHLYDLFCHHFSLVIYTAKESSYQTTQKEKKRRTFKWLIIYYNRRKNLWKSLVIWKPFKSTFIWRQAGIAIFFRLEMALVWVKTLPISVSHSICKIAFLQISDSLCNAPPSKPFEIQIWDWSRLKDCSKIFKKIFFENSENYFLYLFYQLVNRSVFFYPSSTLPSHSSYSCHTKIL